MVQFEFPFTRVGQLQAYNNKQLGHMYTTYRQYLDGSLIQHNDQRWTSWQHMYVDSGMAKMYADDHKAEMFGPVVEQGNDKVIMRYNRRPIAQHTIDDILLAD